MLLVDNMTFVYTVVFFWTIIIQKFLIVGMQKETGE